MSAFISRFGVLVLAACLVTPQASANAADHSYAAFQTQALASVDAWGKPRLTSQGTREARSWGSRLAIAAVVGAMSLQITAQQAKPFRPLPIPPRISPAQNLFVNVDGYKRVQRLFADMPWLEQAYQFRIRGLALQNRSAPIPASIPDTAVAERYEHLGVAFATEYRISGDRVYFNQARAVLRGIAAGFSPSDSRIRDNDGLEFSIGLIHNLHTYNLLLRDLTGSDRQILIQTYFIPAGQALMVEPYGANPGGNPLVEFGHQKSNHRTFIDAAVAADGLTLGDILGRRMVDFALNDPRGGLMFQLANSILDGAWWENSLAYWRYALEPLIPVARALENNGIPFYAVRSAPMGGSVQQLAENLVRNADANYRSPMWGDGRNDLDAKQGAALYGIAQSMDSRGPFSHLLRVAKPPKQDTGSTIFQLSVFLAQPPLGGIPQVPLPGPASLPAAGLAFRRSDNSLDFFGKPKNQLYLLFAAPAETRNAHNGPQLVTSLSRGGDEDSFLVSGPVNEGSLDARAGPKVVKERRGLDNPVPLVGDQPQTGSEANTYRESNGSLVYQDDNTIEGFSPNAYAAPVDLRRQSRLIKSDDPRTPDYLFDVVQVQPRRSDPGPIRMVVPGPLGAALVDSSFVPQDAPRLPGETFDTLTKWQAPVDDGIQGPISWTLRSAAGGVRFVLAETPGTATSIRLAQGTPVDSQNLPLVLLTHADNSGMFVVFEIPFDPDQLAQTQQLDIHRLDSNNVMAAGARVTEPAGEHWHIAVLGNPGSAVLSRPDQPETRVVVSGKKADVHIQPQDHRIVVTGDVVEFRLPEPAGGIFSVIVNGKSVPFKHANGYILLNPHPQIPSKQSSRLNRSA